MEDNEKFIENKTRNGTTFECASCRRDYQTKYNVKKHYDMVHLKLKPYACDICAKQFSTNGSLSRHKKSVHAVVIVKPTLKTSKVVPCMYCPVRFSDKSNMRAHMKIKHYKQYLKFVRKRLKYKRPKVPLPIYNIRGYNETEYKPYEIEIRSGGGDRSLRNIRITRKKLHPKKLWEVNELGIKRRQFI